MTNDVTPGARLPARRDGAPRSARGVFYGGSARTRSREDWMTSTVELLHIKGSRRVAGALFVIVSTLLRGPFVQRYAWRGPVWKVASVNRPDAFDRRGHLYVVHPLLVPVQSLSILRCKVTAARSSPPRTPWRRRLSRSCRRCRVGAGLHIRSARSRCRRPVQSGFRWPGQTRRDSHYVDAPSREPAARLGKPQYRATGQTGNSAGPSAETM